jgi:hypothetical protein
MSDPEQIQETAAEIGRPPWPSAQGGASRASPRRSPPSTSAARYDAANGGGGDFTGEIIGHRVNREGDRRDNWNFIIFNWVDEWISVHVIKLALSNGSQWSEIASILRQFTFSLFCKKL